MKRMIYLIAGTALLAITGFSADEQQTRDIPEHIVKKVDPAVVCIMHERACGSGFVVSKDGYILTNGHVVQGNDSEDPLQPAKLITVITSDEKKYPAKVLGFCLNPDVALIKIESGTEMIPVEFADSRLVQIGEKCFAVGAPLGLKRTFTSGILSSIDRTDLGTLTKVFQTDAAINPGNSGGPLFDNSGRVIGINTYGMGQANNLGFTIPAHVILVLKDHFMKHGRFIRSDVPLCILSELYDELAKALKVDKGIMVDYVMPGTPAEKAGLKAGDIITEIDGKPCSARKKAEMMDINWDIIIKEPGTKMTLTVLGETAQGRTARTIVVNLVEEEPIPETEFPGEIVTHRYDTLGLGFKQLVRLHRLLYGAEPENGIMLDIPGSDKDGTFTKAGLRSFDVVTQVSGKPVSDTEGFRRELETCLGRKQKYIDVTAKRGKAVINTTLAPYYDLNDRKVAIVMPASKSEYLDLILRELMATAADLTIVPTGSDKPAIKRDFPVTMKTLQEINGSNYNAVIFLDGAANGELIGSKDAVRVMNEAYAAKRVIGAIGSSALILTAGSQEMLKKKITSSENVSAELISKKANYTGSKVESDDTIVTTTGFDKETVRDFLKTFRQVTKGTDLVVEPVKK